MNFNIKGYIVPRLFVIIKTL